MKIPKILSSLVLGLTLGASVASANPPMDASLRPYALTSGSTSTRVGITFSEEVSDEASLGIDSSKLFAQDYKERSGGIQYTRKLGSQTLGGSIGISEIKLDDPIYLYENNGDIILTNNVEALYFEANYTHEIFKGLSARLSYQRNFARSEVMDNGYPKERTSVGLEGKITF